MSHNNNLYLGVNIDHVATLRQARFTRYPDPVAAVYAAENGGADGITVHLREDRRHIQERDIDLIQKVLLTRLNLEMALTDEMIQYAMKIKPAHCCIVPEKRQELTTEGGLDVVQNEKKIKEGIKKLGDMGVQVSLYVDPDPQQIDAALRVNAPVIELHTGHYANAKDEKSREIQLKRLNDAATYATKANLIVNAGHGLNYQNVEAVAKITSMNELNIGHSIIARAIFVGLENAVKEMKHLMLNARTA